MGFESLDELNKEALTKAYRSLMRKHHPDLYCHDIEKQKSNEKIAKAVNEANEILVNILSQVEAFKKWENATKKTEVFAIIPFESLFDIYDGKPVKLKSGDDTFEITKGNIKAHRIVLCIECSIICNGITYRYSTLKPAVFGDEYTIDCDIAVIDTNPIDIKVLAYGKEVNISLKNNTLLKLRYRNSINLTLDIRRKLITKSKEEGSDS